MPVFIKIYIKTLHYFQKIKYLCARNTYIKNEKTTIKA